MDAQAKARAVSRKLQQTINFKAEDIFRIVDLDFKINLPKDNSDESIQYLDQLRESKEQEIASKIEMKCQTDGTNRIHTECMIALLIEVFKLKKYLLVKAENVQKYENINHINLISNSLNWCKLFISKYRIKLLSDIRGKSIILFYLLCEVHWGIQLDDFSIFEDIHQMYMQDVIISCHTFDFTTLPSPNMNKNKPSIIRFFAGQLVGTMGLIQIELKQYQTAINNISYSIKIRKKCLQDKDVVDIFLPNEQKIQEYYLIIYYLQTKKCRSLLKIGRLAECSSFGDSITYKMKEQLEIWQNKIQQLQKHKDSLQQLSNLISKVEEITEQSKLNARKILLEENDIQNILSQLTDRNQKQVSPLNQIKTNSNERQKKDIPLSLFPAFKVQGNLKYKNADPNKDSLKIKDGIQEAQQSLNNFPQTNEPIENIQEINEDISLKIDCLQQEQQLKQTQQNLKDNLQKKQNENAIIDNPQQPQIDSKRQSIAIKQRINRKMLSSASPQKTKITNISYFFKQQDSAGQTTSSKLLSNTKPITSRDTSRREGKSPYHFGRIFKQDESMFRDILSSVGKEENQSTFKQIESEVFSSDGKFDMKIEEKNSDSKINKMLESQKKSKSKNESNQRLDQNKVHINSRDKKDRKDQQKSNEEISFAKPKKKFLIPKFTLSQFLPFQVENLIPFPSSDRNSSTNAPSSQPFPLSSFQNIDEQLQNHSNASQIQMVSIKQSRRGRKHSSDLIRVTPNASPSNSPHSKSGSNQTKQINTQFYKRIRHFSEPKSQSYKLVHFDSNSQENDAQNNLKQFHSAQEFKKQALLPDYENLPNFFLDKQNQEYSVPGLRQSKSDSQIGNTSTQSKQERLTNNLADSKARVNQNNEIVVPQLGLNQIPEYLERQNKDQFRQIAGVSPPQSPRSFGSELQFSSSQQNFNTFNSNNLFIRNSSESQIQHKKENQQKKLQFMHIDQRNNSSDDRLSQNLSPRNKFQSSLEEANYPQSNSPRSIFNQFSFSKIDNNLNGSFSNQNILSNVIQNNLVDQNKPLSNQETSSSHNLPGFNPIQMGEKANNQNSKNDISSNNQLNSGQLLIELNKRPNSSRDKQKQNSLLPSSLKRQKKIESNNKQALFRQSASASKSFIDFINPLTVKQPSTHRVQDNIDSINLSNLSQQFANFTALSSLNKNNNGVQENQQPISTIKKALQGADILKHYKGKLNEEKEKFKKKKMTVKTILTQFHATIEKEDNSSTTPKNENNINIRSTSQFHSKGSDRKNSPHFSLDSYRKPPFTRKISQKEQQDIEKDKETLIVNIEQIHEMQEATEQIIRSSKRMDSWKSQIHRVKKQLSFENIDISQNPKQSEENEDKHQNSIQRQLSPYEQHSRRSKFSFQVKGKDHSLLLMQSKVYSQKSFGGESHIDFQNDGTLISQKSSQDSSQILSDSFKEARIAKEAEEDKILILNNESQIKNIKMPLKDGDQFKFQDKKRMSLVNSEQSNWIRSQILIRKQSIQLNIPKNLDVQSRAYQRSQTSANLNPILKMNSGDKRESLPMNGMLNSCKVSFCSPSSPKILADDFRQNIQFFKNGFTNSYFKQEANENDDSDERKKHLSIFKLIEEQNKTYEVRDKFINSISGVIKGIPFIQQFLCYPPIAYNLYCLGTLKRIRLSISIKQIQQEVSLINHKFEEKNEYTRKKSNFNGNEINYESLRSSEKMDSKHHTFKNILFEEEKEKEKMFQTRISIKFDDDLKVSIPIDLKKELGEFSEESNQQFTTVWPLLYKGLTSYMRENHLIEDRFSQKDQDIIIQTSDQNTNNSNYHKMVSNDSKMYLSQYQKYDNSVSINQNYSCDQESDKVKSSLFKLHKGRQSDSSTNSIPDSAMIGSESFSKINIEEIKSLYEKLPISFKFLGGLSQYFAREKSADAQIVIEKRKKKILYSQDFYFLEALISKVNQFFCFSFVFSQKEIGRVLVQDISTESYHRFFLKPLFFLKQQLSRINLALTEFQDQEAFYKILFDKQSLISFIKNGNNNNQSLISSILTSSSSEYFTENNELASQSYNSSYQEQQSSKQQIKDLTFKKRNILSRHKRIKETYHNFLSENQESFQKIFEVHAKASPETILTFIKRIRGEYFLIIVKLVIKQGVDFYNVWISEGEFALIDSVIFYITSRPLDKNMKQRRLVLPIEISPEQMRPYFSEREYDWLIRQSLSHFITCGKWLKKPLLSLLWFFNYQIGVSMFSKLESGQKSRGKMIFRDTYQLSQMLQVKNFQHQRGPSLYNILIRQIGKQGNQNDIPRTMLEAFEESMEAKFEQVYLEQMKNKREGHSQYNNFEGGESDEENNSFLNKSNQSPHIGLPQVISNDLGQENENQPDSTLLKSNQSLYLLAMDNEGNICDRLKKGFNRSDIITVMRLLSLRIRMVRGILGTYPIIMLPNQAENFNKNKKELIQQKRKEIVFKSAFEGKMMKKNNKKEQLLLSSTSSASQNLQPFTPSQMIKDSLTSGGEGNMKKSRFFNEASDQIIDHTIIESNQSLDQTQKCENSVIQITTSPIKKSDSKIITTDVNFNHNKDDENLTFSQKLIEMDIQSSQTMSVQSHKHISSQESPSKKQEAINSSKKASKFHRTQIESYTFSPQDLKVSFQNIKLDQEHEHEQKSSSLSLSTFSHGILKHNKQIRVKETLPKSSESSPKVHFRQRQFMSKTLIGNLTKPKFKKVQSIEEIDEIQNVEEGKKIQLKQEETEQKDISEFKGEENKKEKNLLLSFGISLKKNESKNRQEEILAKLKGKMQGEVYNSQIPSKLEGKVTSDSNIETPNSETILKDSLNNCWQNGGEQMLSELRVLRNFNSRHDFSNEKQLVSQQKGFLDHYMLKSRIIGQFVKRLTNNEYVIITVRKDFILKCWDLQIYVPKTQRVLLSQISHSELIDCSNDFLNSNITPKLQFFFENKNMLSFQNYLQFVQRLTKYSQIPRQSVSSTGSTQRPQKTLSTNLQDSNSPPINPPQIKLPKSGFLGTILRKIREIEEEPSADNSMAQYSSTFSGIQHSPLLRDKSKKENQTQESNNQSFIEEEQQLKNLPSFFGKIPNETEKISSPQKNSFWNIKKQQLEKDNLIFPKDHIISFSKSNNTQNNESERIIVHTEEKMDLENIFSNFTSKEDFKREDASVNDGQGEFCSPLSSRKGTFRQIMSRNNSDSLSFSEQQPSLLSRMIESSIKKGSRALAFKMVEHQKKFAKEILPQQNVEDRNHNMYSSSRLDSEKSQFFVDRQILPKNIKQSSHKSTLIKSFGSPSLTQSNHLLNEDDSFNAEGEFLQSQPSSYQEDFSSPKVMSLQGFPSKKEILKISNLSPKKKKEIVENNFSLFSVKRSTSKKNQTIQLSQSPSKRLKQSANIKRHNTQIPQSIQSPQNSKKSPTNKFFERLTSHSKKNQIEQIKQNLLESSKKNDANYSQSNTSSKRDLKSLIMKNKNKIIGERNVNVLADFMKPRQIQKFLLQQKMQMITEEMDNAFVTGNFTERSEGLVKFIELTIWQNLLSKCDFKPQDKHFKVVLIFGNNRLNIREQLFHEYMRVDQNNESIVEVDVELQESVLLIHRDPALSSRAQLLSYFFTSFKSIPYSLTSNFSFSVQNVIINKGNVSKFNVNVRELLNLFIAEGFYRFQTNYMSSKVNYSELKNLAYFLVHKIKNSNFLELMKTQERNLTIDNMRSSKNFQESNNLKSNSNNPIPSVNLNVLQIPHNLINNQFLKNHRKKKGRQNVIILQEDNIMFFYEKIIDASLKLIMKVSYFTRGNKIQFSVIKCGTTLSVSRNKSLLYFKNKIPFITQFLQDGILMDRALSLISDYMKHKMILYFIVEHNITIKQQYFKNQKPPSFSGQILLQLSGGQIQPHCSPNMLESKESEETYLNPPEENEENNQEDEEERNQSYLENSLDQFEYELESSNNDIEQYDQERSSQSSQSQSSSNSNLSQ